MRSAARPAAAARDRSRRLRAVLPARSRRVARGEPAGRRFAGHFLPRVVLPEDHADPMAGSRGGAGSAFVRAGRGAWPCRPGLCVTAGRHQAGTRPRGPRRARFDLDARSLDVRSVGRSVRRPLPARVRRLGALAAPGVHADPSPCAVARRDSYGALIIYSNVWLCRLEMRYGPRTAQRRRAAEIPRCARFTGKAAVNRATASASLASNRVVCRSAGNSIDSRGNW